MGPQSLKAPFETLLGRFQRRQLRQERERAHRLLNKLAVIGDDLNTRMRSTFGRLRTFSLSLVSRVAMADESWRVTGWGKSFEPAPFRRSFSSSQRRRATASTENE